MLTMMSKVRTRRKILTSCGNERRPSRRDEVKGEDDNKNDEERTAMNSRYNDNNKKNRAIFIGTIYCPNCVLQRYHC